MVYTVVDIETTGLSPQRHKITEIAAVKLDEDCNIINEFQSLVNPECKIPSFITKLTGIDNDMVADKPVISEVMPQFLEFIKNDIFIAHNASFDYRFLSANAELIGKDLFNTKLCTRKLANRLLFDKLPSMKLGHICNHYGIDNNQAHRAMSDVKATVEVFRNFKKEMSKENINNKDDILRFEQRPRKK